MRSATRIADVADADGICRQCGILLKHKAGFAVVAVRYVVADVRFVRVIVLGPVWPAGHLAREPRLRALLCAMENTALLAVHREPASGVDSIQARQELSD